MNTFFTDILICLPTHFSLMFILNYLKQQSFLFFLDNDVYVSNDEITFKQSLISDIATTVLSEHAKVKKILQMSSPVTRTIPQPHVFKYYGYPPLKNLVDLQVKYSVIKGGTYLNLVIQRLALLPMIALKCDLLRRRVLWASSLPSVL